MGPMEAFFIGTMIGSVLTLAAVMCPVRKPK